MWRICFVVASLWFAASWAWGADANTEGMEFFEKKIRPLLVERCYECHSGDAAESGLRLDSLAAILKGGQRGPAITPGKPHESLLIGAVRHGELLKMPPKSKLSTNQLADLEKWVVLGAPWPGAVPLEPTPVSTATATVNFSAAQRSHWAFQPIVARPIPAVTNQGWVSSPIDPFILQRLEASGLFPAPPAAKATLIRRVTFDLIGIPPTPEEVDAFLSDEAPDAFAHLIDRLLLSPLYGQRWGRHWLDVARYADSNGLDENLAYANAFRYRDYVISAFNRDKSFDTFVQEQIAGDLLDGDGPADAPFERFVATGFLSLGAKMLAEDDPLKMQMDIIDEQVDTIGRAYLGLTLGCARCHDHKFDPVSMADYYGLAGIFKSTHTMDTHTVVARWHERPLANTAAIQSRDEQLAKIDAIEQRIKETVQPATEHVLHDARRHAGDYLIAAQQAEVLEQWQAQTKPLGNNPEAIAKSQAILIEAEDFVRGNILQDSSNYGEGIGVLVNKGELPNFAEYDVTVSQDGLYQIELRYAAASSRPTLLIINGQLAKSDAAAGVTGSWAPEGQQWRVEGFYPLRAGSNVLRLEQPQFFPHIDKLLITPAPSEVRLLEPLSPSTDYKPVPEFVVQWRKYLASQMADQSGIFTLWLDLIADGTIGETGHTANALVDRLLADPRPTNAQELAMRYGDRFTRVVDAWEKAVSADKSVSQLADPIDDSFRVVLYDPHGPYALPKTIENHFSPQDSSALTQWRAEKSAAEAALPKLPEAMSVRDDAPQDLRIHIRGSHLSLGATVARGFPRMILETHSPVIATGQSGRRELSQWLVNPENPLTPRVIVNRIWQWHFGEGLVHSPDNFGLLGDSPTHPELLDWLAARFVASGWSIKELHRLILMSSTYQMSSQTNALGLEKDPDNRLWSRFNRRRLEAETIRDALLAGAGQMDLQFGGSLLPTPNRQYVTSTASVDPVVYQSNRRSVYLPVVRSALYDVFQVFDFADPSVSQGKRETTTVAPQALFMMNSKLVSQQACQMAEGLLGNSSLDDRCRVEVAFRRSLGRQPSPSEVDRALRFVSDFSNRLAANQSHAAESRVRAWQSFCRAVLSTNEFVYVD